MSKIEKKRTPFGFVISEGNGTISRGYQAVDLGAGAEAGTPLGRITSSNTLVPWDSAATDGSQVIDCILGSYGAGTGRALTVGRGSVVNVPDLVFDEADYDDLLTGLAGIGVFGIEGKIVAASGPVLNITDNGDGTSVVNSIPNAPTFTMSDNEDGTSELTYVA